MDAFDLSYTNEAQTGSRRSVGPTHMHRDLSMARPGQHPHMGKLEKIDPMMDQKSTTTSFRNSLEFPIEVFWQTEVPRDPFDSRGQCPRDGLSFRAPEGWR